MAITRSRRAVVVGVAQVRRKPDVDGLWDPKDPGWMMAEVIKSAALDAGGCQLTQEADLLACVDPVAWGYDDLIGTVAEMAGMTGPASPRPPAGLTVAPGGDSPCQLLNRVANRVVEGDSRVALIAGADAVYSRRRAMKEGVDLTALGWAPYEGHRDFLKGQRPITNDLEARHGMVAPIQCYPLYENALRFEAGRTIPEHQMWLGEMMAAHAAVAADNPFAWFPIAYRPEEITTVSPGNRAVCFPYPKRMNAIIEVDQGAAMVVMSSDEADRRGVPDNRRIGFLGGADSADAWTPTERASLTSSPAYRLAATAALEHAALYATEVELFDLYSCFPSAVEFAMKVLLLTLDDPRPRTVTGGLAYAGGPGNSYSMMALAAMVERLRTTAARVGYVSALGMTATKHAVSVLSSDSTRMTAATGRSTEAIPVPDKLKFGPRLSDTPDAGHATVEAYTLEYDREGHASRSLFVLKLADGQRTVANGTQEDFRMLFTEEAVGRRGWIAPSPAGGGINRFSLGSPPA